MSSTIVKAAERLAQLRRAGVDIPLMDLGSELMAGDDHAPARPALGADAAERARLGLPGGSTVEIDLARLAAAGILTPDNLRSQIALEFGIIKRPLLDNVRGKSAAPVGRANLIMVTSALPGEGKTFAAVNLALSIAMELDHSVLLVEADVHRPAVLSTLGLPPSPGLMDVLTDPQVKLGGALLRTNVPKLTLLPAGSQHSRTTEVLSSQSMANLVRELATRYSDRVIIFDTPPLLQTPESRALAAHMGQVVVVVAADSTTHGTIHAALQTLENCPIVMTMLNKAARSKPEYSYGRYGAGSATAARA